MKKYLAILLLPLTAILLLAQTVTLPGPFVPRAAGGAATVSLVGSCTDTAFAASINYSVPSTLASGTGAVFFFVGGSTYTSTITISDTASNTGYQTDFNHTFTAYAQIEQFRSVRIVNAITGGGHFTIALSNGGSESWYVCVFSNSTMASGTWFDQSGFIDGNTFSTSQNTGTTAATTNATDLCIGTLTGSGWTSATWAGGYALLNTGATGGSREVTSAWKATSSTGTQQGTATIGVNDTTNGAIACYKQ